MSDFRMGMDPIGRFDQLRRAAIDRLANAIFQLVHLVRHHK
jgi:hypothetical protein